MTIPTDIHTHRPPAQPGQAIVNCTPDTFAPREGEYCSVGIHPWDVADGIATETWERLQQLVHHPQVLAVGEAGMDKLAAAPMPLQEEVFLRQVLLAEEAGKPLIIHLVKATDLLLRLKRQLRPSVSWVIHGFRGKAPQAEMWTRHGVYLSFGARYDEDALRSVPADRLLLETDEAEVAVEALCRRAATLRQVPAAQLSETVRGNVARLFFGL